MKPSTIRRPTEDAAYRVIGKGGKRLPDSPVLFAGLMTAQAIKDRHAISLFAHAIARLGGEGGE